jgi:L-threonylcarbamoyladenylate synthase
MSQVEEAASIIRTGGVVAIPTDTVYGLACDPADAVAVERIYAIKARPADLELTLLGADRRSFEPLVEFDEWSGELAGKYWPGPLSIILPLAATAPGQRRLAVPRGGTTLSVRVPSHSLLLELLAITGPLATTSANLHGQEAASSADQARAAVGADVDMVVDGGSGGGIASTIIDCSCQPPRVLREGPISADQLLPHPAHQGSEK